MLVWLSSIDLNERLSERERKLTMSLSGVLVLLCVLSVATPSRLPLVVFQHHHPHRHPSDASDEGQATAVPSPTKLHPYHYHVQDTTEDASPPPSQPPPSTHHTHPPQSGNEVGEHNLRVLYQVGSSEEDLPECSPWTVCSKVDMYESPWVERQCRCPGQQSCPTFKSFNDGHTLSDKTRQFKLCEPVKKLPKCRYFRDITWTLITSPDNTTEQVVHCHCPKGAVAYLIKRQGYQTTHGLAGYQYSFACSPQSRLRCQRKEPCRLFTVRKRQELLDEVNTNTLCQCPHSFGCPRHHTDPGVIQGKSYTEEAIKTYSGYCVA